MFYDPEQIVSFETAANLKKKAYMTSPHIAGPIENLNDSKKLEFVALYSYYDDNKNVVKCHQYGYDYEYDEKFRNTYRAIHKTFYLTYAPTLEIALKWLESFNHLKIELKSETKGSDGFNLYDIILTYKDGNNIFAIRYIDNVLSGNEAIENAINLLFKKHSELIYKIPDLMKDLLKVETIKTEQYIPETELYKWIDCSNENYWLEVPGYASIIQINGRVIAQSNCEYSWSDIVKFKGKIMHIEL